MSISTQPSAESVLQCAHPIFSNITVVLGPSGLRGDSYVCTICLEDIGPDKLTYRHDICGVAFDYHCLEFYMATRMQRCQSLKCPLCQGEFQYDPNRSPELPVSSLLSPHQHDYHRINSGEQVLDPLGLAQLPFQISKRVLELSAKCGPSHINTVIETYAQIRHITVLISDRYERHITTCKLVREMAGLIAIPIEHYMDDTVMQRANNELTEDNIETAASRILVRSQALKHYLFLKCVLWKRDIELVESLRHYPPDMMVGQER